MQTLPSAHVIAQLAVLQLCVQSSPFLQTQGASAAQVFVDVGPASGTDPFEPDDAPLEPDDAPLEPLEPADPEELAPVSSPSLLQAGATTQTRLTTAAAANRTRSGGRCKFTSSEYEPVAGLSIRFDEGRVMEVPRKCG